MLVVFFVHTFEAISSTFEITLKLFNKYSFCVYSFPCTSFPADSFQCVYDNDVERGKPMKKLTDKQKRFCEEYVVDLNAIRAYKLVYANCKSDRTASANSSRLLANANVAAYVRELKEQIAQEAKVTAADVLKDLIEVKNRCMQATPVKVWDSDSHSYVDSDAEFTFDSKGANTALKLIGEHLGMFQKKVELSGGLETKQSKVDDVIEQLKVADEE